MATCVGERHYNPNSKRVTSVVTDAITMVFQFSRIKFFMVCPFLGGLSGGFVETVIVKLDMLLWSSCYF